jgi:hypothetical protein
MTVCVTWSGNLPQQTLSVGALAASLIVAGIFLVFAILSLFVTVFIVDAAAIIAGAAIVAGGSGLTLAEE